MKKYYVVLLFLLIHLSQSYSQVLCVNCFNQNGRVSPAAGNLLLNGSLESGCNQGGKFCPTATTYNCNIDNWTCTGGGVSTYANIVISSFSVIPDGAKAAYFGNSYCKSCSSSANDTTCFVDSGCVVTGIPAGYPTHTANYGDSTGVNLEQTVSGLTPGNVYALEFWVGGENFLRGGVFAVNVGYGKIYLRDKPTPTGSTGTRYLIQFIASNAQHTIRFTNWGHPCSTCTELVLDDIVLYDIDELVASVVPCTPISFSNTCTGDTTSFNVVNVAQLDSVSWNFGDPSSGAQNYSNLFNPFHYYSQPGSYMVTLIRYEWGGIIDTINRLITINTHPVFSLGNDTAACRLIHIDAGAGYSSYLWSTGFTGQHLITNIAGTYAATVTNSEGCSTTDTIALTLFLAFINLGSDVSVCGQGSVALSPGSGFTSYVWNNGLTTPQINVQQSGSYSVQVIDTNGCSASDTIQVAFHPLPYINLGPDVVSCGPYTINAGAGYNTYVWSTGSTSQTALVDVTNFYTVSVTDNFQCTNRDTIHITIIPLPDIHLGNDTSICTGNTFLLNASSAFDNYLWQNGSTDSVFAVTLPGTYFVTVADSSCSATDTIVVTTAVCAPDPSLSADNSLLCQPGCINFTDQSVNGPVTWSWYFPNAVPDTSSLQNPVSICYAQPGTYAVTLIACNSAGCNTVYLSSYVTVLSPISVTISLSSDTLYANPPNLSYEWYEFSQPANILSVNSYYATTQSGYYYVVATDSNGCETTSNIMLVTTGINDQGNSKQSDIHLYYKEGLLNVFAKPPLVVLAECKVYDVQGRLTAEHVFKGSETTIDLKSVSKGIYFLKLQTGKKVYWKKFRVD